jgi:hypothetical protein
MKKIFLIALISVNCGFSFIGEQNVCSEQILKASIHELYLNYFPEMDKVERIIIEFRVLDDCHVVSAKIRDPLSLNCHDGSYEFLCKIESLVFCPKYLAQFPRKEFDHRIITLPLVIKPN